MNKNTPRPTLDDLVPVNVFARRFPHLGTEAAWRWKIFNAAHNGLDEAEVIVRSGGRVFIVQPRALDFFLSQAA